MSSPVSTVTPIKNPSAYSVAPSRMSPSKGGMSSMKGQLSQRDLWVFVVVAIILIIALAFIAKDHREVFENLKTCSWNSNFMLSAVILGLGILVLAYCCYMAFCVADMQSKTLIAVTFGLIAALLVIAFTLFFRNGNFSGAFYASMFILLLAVLCMYFCWRVKKSAGYGSIVFVVIAALLAWGFWDVTSKNSNHEPRKHHHHHHH